MFRVCLCTCSSFFLEIHSFLFSFWRLHSRTAPGMLPHLPFFPPLTSLLRSPCICLVAVLSTFTGFLWPIHLLDYTANSLRVGAGFVYLCMHSDSLSGTEKVLMRVLDWNFKRMLRVETGIIKAKEMGIGYIFISVTTLWGRIIISILLMRKLRVIEIKLGQRSQTASGGATTQAWTSRIVLRNDQ